MVNLSVICLAPLMKSAALPGTSEKRWPENNTLISRFKNLNLSLKYIYLKYSIVPDSLQKDVQISVGWK